MTDITVQTRQKRRKRKKNNVYQPHSNNIHQLRR
jgi:hypothetical protein